MTQMENRILEIIRDNFCFSSYNPNGKYYVMNFTIKNREDFDVIFQFCTQNSKRIILRCSTIKGEEDEQQKDTGIAETESK